MSRLLNWSLFAGLLAMLMGQLQASAIAQELKLATGKAMPFALRDLDGREHRLADYRGKVVVLNFWATWCEPCREEMPSLDRLAAKLAGRPFAVLAVDYAEGAPRVREFAARQALRFPLLLDRDGSVTKSWGVRTLPATYVIDAGGQLRHVAVGAMDWESPEVLAAIERLLSTH
jgi:cytochrome c biogenesis protein CcmG, thiol:disulfide interchange protein DsbE